VNDWNPTNDELRDLVQDTLTDVTIDPTIRDLAHLVLEERARAYQARAALARVEALHPRNPHGDTDVCLTCIDESTDDYASWPCPTIAALATPDTAPGPKADGDA
jgi:hypothetical protein